MGRRNEITCQKQKRGGGGRVSLLKRSFDILDVRGGRRGGGEEKGRRRIDKITSTAVPENLLVIWGKDYGDWQSEKTKGLRGRKNKEDEA